MLHEDERSTLLALTVLSWNGLHTESWLEQAANEIVFIVCLFQPRLSLSGKL